MPDTKAATKTTFNCDKAETEVLCAVKWDDSINSNMGVGIHNYVMTIWLCDVARCLSIHSMWHCRVSLTLFTCNLWNPLNKEIGNKLIILYAMRKCNLYNTYFFQHEAITYFTNFFQPEAINRFYQHEAITFHSINITLAYYYSYSPFYLTKKAWHPLHFVYALVSKLTSTHTILW